MMARSPVRRRGTARNKTESEPLAKQCLNTTNNVFLAPNQGQGQTKASVGAPEGPESDDTESGKAKSESDLASVSVGKSPNHTGESPSDRNKQVHKLDDQAFKPFGPRSRASSEAGSDASSCCLGGPNKPTCGEPVKNSDDGVQCEKCEHWFHITCQGIPKPAYEALKKYKVLSWFCSGCKAQVGHTATKDNLRLTTLESKVEQLNKDIKEHLGRMIHSLREQERSVDGQTKLIERSIRESVTQKASYAEMVKGSCSEMVSQVSAKLSSFPQLAAAHAASKDVQNMSKVFDDFLNKDRRKSNLVIHNLPEPEAASLAERSENDARVFQQLAKDEFRLHVRVSRCFRVGKSIAGRHRLLIVTLENPETKHDLLRLAPQLRSSLNWGNVYITPDLTKAERETAKKLREELKARKLAGEDDLVIRKGRIVQSSGRQATSATSEAKTAEVGEPDGNSAPRYRTKFQETPMSGEGCNQGSDAASRSSRDSDEVRTGNQNRNAQA